MSGEYLHVCMLTNIKPLCLLFFENQFHLAYSKMSHVRAIMLTSNTAQLRIIQILQLVRQRQVELLQQGGHRTWAVVRFDEFFIFNTNA